MEDNASDIAKSSLDLKSIDIGQVACSLLLSDKPKKSVANQELETSDEIPISLKLGQFDANDISFRVGFTSGELELTAMLRKAQIIPEIIDFTSQSISLHQLMAHEIDVGLHIHPGDSIDASQQIELKAELPFTEYTFGDFDWTVQVNHVELTKASCEMDLNSNPRKSAGMDYLHMDYSNFNVVADSLFLDKNNAAVILASMSLSEISGPEIHDLRGDFFMDNRSIVAKGIALKTGKSKASGSFELSYPAFHKIASDVGQVGIECKLKGFIDVSEIQPFYSELNQFTVLQNLEGFEIINLQTEGIISDLNFRMAEIALGKSTVLRASWSIAGLPTKNIELSFEVDTLYTTRDDLMKLLPDTLLPASIALPQAIGLKLTGETDLKSSELSSHIASDFGQIILNANLINDQVISDFAFINLDVGAIVKDSIFGFINFRGNIEGALIDNDLHSLNLKSQLESLEFNEYAYQNARLNMDWVKDNISFVLDIQDTSLIGNLEGSIVNKDSLNHYDVSLELEKSELHRLNFMDEKFSVNGHISIDMDVTSKDDFKGLIKAENIGMEDDESSFKINTVYFDSDINENYTNFLLKSEILDASLTGNTKIMELKEALIDQIDLFIELPDSIVNDKNFIFDLDLNLKNPDIFTEFLVPGIDEIRLEECYARYDDEANELEANISIPGLSYKGFIFDDLHFNIDSYSDSAIATMSLKSLSYDSVFVNNIKAKSIFIPNHAETSFSIRDRTKRLKHQLSIELNYTDSIYELHLEPDQMVFNYGPWKIPEDNFLRFDKNSFSTQSATMRNQDQEVWLDLDNNDIIFNFKNFGLENIMGIIEDDSLNTIIGGQINGFVKVIDLLSAPGLDSELSIPDLTLLAESFGNFQSKILYNRDLNFDIEMQNKDNSILLSGIMPLKDEDTNFNIVMESNIADASSFQPFVSSYLKDLHGSLQGRLSVIGKKHYPLFNGSFTVDNLNVTVSSTNTLLKHNGQITLDDNAIIFDKFEVKDSLGNPFILDGNVNLGDLNNPIYDLKLSTDNFLAVNSKPNNNQHIFGTALMGLNAEITGYQSNLNVNSEISINENTDITYVMPGQELELISDEGIVEFFEFEDKSYEVIKNVENQFFGDSLVALIDGIDFTARLNVHPRAKFTVVVDPNSGDFTTFQFTGKMQYNYNDTQRGILNGLIEMEEGFYELSFYGLVKKRFNYDPGSTISWSGDVMDGIINFAARHTVRTNSVSLVSNEISSYERALYNQRLPYDVILRINDKISYPTISFEIDLPTRYRSTYPTLDSKLNIMNQPNMEAERNKQVFALLVGGTFIPENPDINEGSSSGDFATTAARNSVNAIMTQQLNKLTGQFIQGLDVDMGVNTFDDFSGGSAQTRTQLDVKVSKKLFNDRVSADMESHIDIDGSNKQVAGQSNAGMTEFAVSYKLTEAGNYRIKAFRENAYDIFDGEIQNAGVAFIFVREFDSFKNIRPAKQSEIILKTDKDSDEN